MNKPNSKPTRNPVKRLRVGKEERRNERGIAARRFLGLVKSVTTRAVPIGCGLIFLFLLKFVFFIGYVPTASMEPSIREDSLIFGARVFEKLEKGDVVVFMHEGRLLVKRIAGVQGDIVYNTADESMTVPFGCYYMLGDNAKDSVDSRSWDEPFVYEKDIIAVIWSAR